MCHPRGITSLSSWPIFGQQHAHLQSHQPSALPDVVGSFHRLLRGDVFVAPLLPKTRPCQTNIRAKRIIVNSTTSRGWGDWKEKGKLCGSKHNRSVTLKQNFLLDMAINTLLSYVSISLLFEIDDLVLEVLVCDWIFYNKKTKSSLPEAFQNSMLKSFDH